MQYTIAGYYIGSRAGWYPAFTDVQGYWKERTTNAHEKALSRIQSKISQTALNAAQAFAERKQTASLIAQSVRRMVSLALLIKKGKFDELYKKYGLPKPVRTRSGAYVIPRYRKKTEWTTTAFDDRGFPLDRPKRHKTETWTEINTRKKFSFGDMWLEFQYGWKPLLQDIYGGCEALARMHTGRYHGIRFEASARAVLDYTQSAYSFTVNGTTFGGQATCKIAETVRYVIEADEDNAVLQTLASTGVTNPALLAWELLPYSFVLDWFIPVGNYLQQLEYARGMSFMRGTKSINRSCVALVKQQTTGVLPDPDFKAGGSFGGDVNIVKTTKARLLLTEFPYAKFPTIQPKLGVERILSGIALLSQLISDRPGRKVR
jgi:hypothetical protein